MRRPAISAQRAVAIIYTAGMFMSIMDVQIVNVALARLGRDFAATPAQVDWVVTGYLLSLAVTIPASGWLGDRIGTRRVYLGAVGLFTVASALCALSVTLPELLAMRVLQGAGGGLMTPVGTTMLYRAYPPDQRVRIARTVTRVTVLAPATAPIIGGLLITGLSWPWIFLINVPTGLAALCFGAAYLPGDTVYTRAPFDVTGFALAGAGLAAVLYAVSEGTTLGWGAPQIWGTGAAGAVLLTVFGRHALRRTDALLRLDLLRQRLFRQCCLLIGAGTTAFFGSLVITALYLQEGRGVSALTSGLTTFPEAVAIGIASQFVARLYPRLGPRPLVVVGFTGLAAVNAGLAFSGADTSLWVIRALMVGIGVSVASVNLPIQAAAYARISDVDTGQASAIFTSLQRSFSALGVAVLATVLASGTGHLRQAPVHAFHAVYAVAAGVALVGALYALRLHNSDAASTMTTRKPDRELTAHH